MILHVHSSHSRSDGCPSAFPILCLDFPNRERLIFRIPSRASFGSKHAMESGWGKPGMAMCAIINFRASSTQLTPHPIAHNQSANLEAVGRLVSGVAHDFNNLLTGIMLYCDVMLAELEPAGPKGLGQEASRDHWRHCMKEIRGAGERGAALIRQLMDIAHQQVTQRRPLAWNQAILETRNLLTRLIGENIEFVTDLADDLAVIEFDPSQAQQVILNLVLNARDAMPHGGKVVLRTRNLTDWSAQAGTPQPQNPDETSAIEFAVTDTGRGMDAHTRAHAFDSFFSTKNRGQSRGLGLATVSAIVSEASGTIQIESEPGKGTHIVVRLPAAPRMTVASKQPRGVSPRREPDSKLSRRKRKLSSRSIPL